MTWNWTEKIILASTFFLDRELQVIVNKNELYDLEEHEAIINSIYTIPSFELEVEINLSSQHKVFEKINYLNHLCFVFEKEIKRYRGFPFINYEYDPDLYISQKSKSDDSIVSNILSDSQISQWGFDAQLFKMYLLLLACYRPLKRKLDKQLLKDNNAVLNSEPVKKEEILEFNKNTEHIYLLRFLGILDGLKNKYGDTNGYLDERNLGAMLSALTRGDKSIAESYRKCLAKFKSDEFDYPQKAKTFINEFLTKYNLNE